MPATSRDSGPRLCVARPAGGPDGDGAATRRGRGGHRRSGALAALAEWAVPAKQRFYMYASRRAGGAARPAAGHAVMVRAAGATGVQPGLLEAEPGHGPPGAVTVDGTRYASTSHYHRYI